jgi:hypothetical protein
MFPVRLRQQYGVSVKRPCAHPDSFRQRREDVIVVAQLFPRAHFSLDQTSENGANPAGGIHLCRGSLRFRSAR